MVADVVDEIQDGHLLFPLCEVTPGGPG